MNFKHLLIATACAISFVACNEDDDTGANLTVEEILSKTNIYPEPPNQWMGGSNPYYTAGYIGDVMPFFDNGKFHLFFLHDAKTKPAGEGFHDIHSFETSNFTDYTYNGRMIPYGTSSQPDFAVGTGAVVKAGSIYYYYYTGHNAIASFLQNNPRESVLLATSTDLKTWTKQPAFKITAPAGYYDFEFRDPHVFYNETDSKYWMLVSAQTDARKAVVLKFTTSDPATGNWAVEGPIYTSTDPENYIMLECPDLFKMGSYWYLSFSENWSDNTGTHYRMSTSPNGPWIKPANDRLDGSYLYAAKTVSDGTKRYLIGWTARKTPESNNGGKDWAGNLVTHEIVQNSDGTLGAKQPDFVSSVFKTNAALTLKSSSGAASLSGSNLTLGAAASVATFENLKSANQITFGLKTGNSGSTGVILSHNPESGSGVKIAFEPSNGRLAAYTMVNGEDNFANAYPFTFDASQTYQVKITTSNNVCTVYVNDKIAFSNRIYNVNATKWSIFGVGEQSSYTNINIKNA